MQMENNIMRIAKEDIPVRINVPGATARQLTDFGDATGYGKISGEYFSHWGYILEGKLIVSFADGHMETAKSSDIFYWPPGHTVRAEEDTEMVLFSPQHEHSQVIDHILSKIQG
jgi:hypothetical protein